MPTASRAEVIWRGDFETGDISQWSRAQMVSPDRLQVVTSPVRQGRYALRAVVDQGDNPINASGNRNELVYLSNEPEGTERFYRWSTMFDSSFPSVDTWQLFTQFHHNGCCGSPPVEFVVRGEEVVLGIQSTAVWRAPLVRGVWHDFIFHVKWSPDPNEGFAELYYDGQIVLPKTNMATQFPGTTNYLKQGLYRDASVSDVGIVYHDGMVIGETLDDVLPPAPPTGQTTSSGGDPSGGQGAGSADPSSSSSGSGANPVKPVGGPASRGQGCSSARSASLWPLMLACLFFIRPRRRA